MRLSFVRDSRPVYLGGRSLGIGPLSVRWGGKWFLVSPLTFFGAMGFAATVDELGGHVLLDYGPEGVPPLLGRVVVPFLLSGFTDADYRHVKRSTDSQVRAVLQAAAEVNGWDTLREIVKPRDQRGARPDAGALDRASVSLGEAFGIWPHEVMAKPWVEVQAVIDARAYDPENPEISDETAAEVKRLAAQRDGHA